MKEKTLDQKIFFGKKQPSIIINEYDLSRFKCQPRALLALTAALTVAQSVSD